MALTFDFTALKGVKNGAKIQTSTPMVSQKGQMNKFGINASAMTLLGVDGDSNVYIMANPAAKDNNGRYLIMGLPGSTKEVSRPGAKIVVKEDDANGSGNFQYAPIWGQILTEKATPSSKEEMVYGGFVKSSYAVKETDFALELVGENVPMAVLAENNPDLAEYSDLNVNIYALVNPVVSEFTKRSIRTASDVADATEDQDQDADATDEQIEE